MKENSSLCDYIADVQNSIDVVSMEREFLLRKLIEYEPSTVDYIQQNEQKYKKRKNSSSDASSINKPLGKKMKTQQSLLKKQSAFPNKLPIIIDGITLLNLGRIVYDRPAYYTDFIYPVGYKVSRIYNNKTYVLRIIDNGITPRFEAFSAMDPSCIYSGAAPDDCVSQLEQFDNLCSQGYIDGHEMFGITNKRILDLINSLPNARRLVKIKQEIKQENTLTSYDDNACNYMMHLK